MSATQMSTLNRLANPSPQARATALHRWVPKKPTLEHGECHPDEYVEEDGGEDHDADAAPLVGIGHLVGVVQHQLLPHRHARGAIGVGDVPPLCPTSSMCTHNASCRSGATSAAGPASRPAFCWGWGCSIGPPCVCALGGRCGMGFQGSHSRDLGSQARPGPRGAMRASDRTWLARLRRLAGVSVGRRLHCPLRHCS